MTPTIRTIALRKVSPIDVRVGEPNETSEQRQAKASSNSHVSGNETVGTGQKMQRMRSSFGNQACESGCAGNGARMPLVQLRTIARRKGLTLHKQSHGRLILISTEDACTYIELGGVAVERVAGILKAMPDAEKGGKR